jgi:hypothetical protein
VRAGARTEFEREQRARDAGEDARDEVQEVEALLLCRRVRDRTFARGHSVRARRAEQAREHKGRDGEVDPGVDPQADAVGRCEELLVREGTDEAVAGVSAGGSRRRGRGLVTRLHRSAQGKSRRCRRR